MIQNYAIQNNDSCNSQLQIRMSKFCSLCRRANHLLILLCMAAIFSCQEDQLAPVPAYIQINDFFFQGNGPDSTGYPTQKISDVWIFVNNQIIGTYAIPTNKIPVLAEGQVRISVQAGVYTDGIRKNRVYYPFYKSYEKDTILEKGKTMVLKPQFFLLREWKGKSLKIPFTFYQDFEVSDAGIVMGDAGTVEGKREFHNNPSLENLYGKRYLKFTTPKDDDAIDAINDVYLPLETNGNPVYLEFDYKSTCLVQVGVKGKVGDAFTGIAQDLVLYPNKDEWTKIYVSLSEETALFHTEALSQGLPASFSFFFRTIPAPGANNYFCIDNIRLLN